MADMDNLEFETLTLEELKKFVDTHQGKALSADRRPPAFGIGTRSQNFI
jgi:hypothetical protein